MDRIVPIATSRWLGTTAVRVPVSSFRANLTWLPLVPTSSNPHNCRRRLTSRYANGLSGIQVDDYVVHHGGDRRARLFEMQSEGLFQIRDCGRLGFTLRGYVELKALGHEPRILLPNGSREISCHFMFYYSTDPQNGHVGRVCLSGLSLR